MTLPADYAGLNTVVVPADHALIALLDQYAPFGPAPLCPEISVFQGRSLVEVWEAAESLAGGQLPAPFWAYPWAAGCGLARVILDEPALVRAKRVLDLGAGGGIVSLAAARAGASEVVANDIDPWALATVRIAGRRQRLDVDCMEADLTHTPAVIDEYEVVVCSDMAYERRMAPKYHALLQRARNHGARVLVADAGRAYFDTRGLEVVAEFTLRVPRDLEGVDERLARVFEWR